MEGTKLIMISVLMGSLHQKVANYVTIDTFITIVLDSNLEITEYDNPFIGVKNSQKNQSKETEEDGFLHSTSTCTKYLP